MRCASCTPAFVLLLLNGCTNHVDSPRTEEIEVEPETARAPDPDPVPGRELAEGGPHPDADPPSLEPVDRTCANAADCVAIYEIYETDDACCQGCSTAAVNAQWHARASAACSARGSEGCPMKKCVELEPVDCVDGRCVVRGER